MLIDIKPFDTRHLSREDAAALLDIAYRHDAAEQEFWSKQGSVGAFGVSTVGASSVADTPETKPKKATKKKKEELAEGYGGSAATVEKAPEVETSSDAPSESQLRQALIEYAGRHDAKKAAALLKKLTGQSGVKTVDPSQYAEVIKALNEA